jgi:hypothetical protein
MTRRGISRSTRHICAQKIQRHHSQTIFKMCGELLLMCYNQIRIDFGRLDPDPGEKNDPQK